VNWQIVVAVLYLALGAVLIWLGTVILRENPKSRVNRITALMLLFAGLGPVFAAIGATIEQNQTGASLPTTFPYNFFFLWELFFPQLLLFAFIFPIEHPFIARFSRVKYLIFAPHIFRFVWMAFLARPQVRWTGFDSQSAILQTLLAPFDIAMRLGAYGLTLLFDFHLKFFSIVNLFYIGAAIWALRLGHKAVTNRRLKDQVGIVLRGIQLAVGLYAVAFILPTLGLIKVYQPLRDAFTIVALMVGAGSIAWSIIRHQFLDVRLIVRQSVVFTISSAFLVGLYLLVVTQVAAFVRNVLELQTPLIDAAFILVVLILFQPLKDRVDDLIARLFLRDRSDPRAILETFSRQISSIFDIEDLKKHMLSVMTEQLFVERAFFIVRDASRQKYVLELAGLSGEGIEATDWFFAEALRRARPSAFEEFVIDRALTPMTEILGRWSCRLVVPVIDRGELTAVLLLGEKVSGYKFTVEDVNLLATLSNQFAVAITNARLYQEAIEKQKLEEELNVARQIQRNLLPRALPHSPHFELAAFTQPSRQVGGDYYDFFFLPDGCLGIVIADVSGKGLGAALLVSQIQAILKAEVRHQRIMARAIANTNAFVSEITAAEQFATMVYSEYNPTTRELTYTNAGHNQPMLVRGDGRHERLDRGGLVLGVMPTVLYEVATVKLHAGDTIFFFTDGLSDLESPAGVDFGEDRVLGLVIQHRGLTADALAREIVREATTFSAGDLGFDDLTMVVFRAT
jgi:sigma-B regulation protein RsbU (phosphoserine phosphatase)